jgi:hypothetical protein
VKGRKIQTLVDGEGLPMRVVVHFDAIQDRDGAGLVLAKIRKRFSWLELSGSIAAITRVASRSCGGKGAAFAQEIVKRTVDSGAGMTVTLARIIHEVAGESGGSGTNS